MICDLGSDSLVGFGKRGQILWSIFGNCCLMMRRQFLFCVWKRVERHETVKSCGIRFLCRRSGTEVAFTVTKPSNHVESDFYAGEVVQKQPSPSRNRQIMWNQGHMPEKWYRSSLHRHETVRLCGIRAICRRSCIEVAFTVTKPSNKPEASTFAEEVVQKKCCPPTNRQGHPFNFIKGSKRVYAIMNSSLELY